MCSEYYRTDNYTGVLGVDLVGMLNESWTTEDGILINNRDATGLPLEISTWFKTIPNEPGKEFYIRPKFRWSSGDEEHSELLELEVSIVGSGTIGKYQPSGKGQGTFACDGNTNQTAPAWPYTVSTTTYRTNIDPQPGEPKKLYVPPGTYVFGGDSDTLAWKLRGSLTFCAWRNKDRFDVRAGVKFAPQSGSKAVDIIAPWLDAPYPPQNVTRLKNQVNTMHWYQTVPRPLSPTGVTDYDDVYLIIPRVFNGNCPDFSLPDKCVVAEGTTFTFCTTDDDPDDLVDTPAPNVGAACPGATTPSAPKGTATFSAADTVSPGIPEVNEHCWQPYNFHHWEGSLDGLIAPDPHSEPLQPFSGTFLLDARVYCENVDSGTGQVLGLTITADGLDFELLESLEFARVGSEVTALVFGVCTTADATYLCELSLTGDWVPKVVGALDDQVEEADVTSGAFLLRYDGDIDTWED